MIKYFLSVLLLIPVCAMGSNDPIVEIPAFVIVLITGVLMLTTVEGGGGLLYVKIAFGLMAIAANVYCVWLVFRRARAANAGQWEAFGRIDHQQRTYGTVFSCF
jgi:hypothetical protein